MEHFEQQGRPLLPVRHFRPQVVAEVVARDRGRADLRMRPGEEEVPAQPGQDRRLAGALAGLHGLARVRREVSEDLVLPGVGLHPEQLADHHLRLLAPQLDLRRGSLRRVGRVLGHRPCIFPWSVRCTASDSRPTKRRPSIGMIDCDTSPSVPSGPSASRITERVPGSQRRDVVQPTLEPRPCPRGMPGTRIDHADHVVVGQAADLRPSPAAAAPRRSRPPAAPGRQRITLPRIDMAHSRPQSSTQCGGLARRARFCLGWPCHDDGRPAIAHERVSGSMPGMRLTAAAPVQPRVQRQACPATGPTRRSARPGSASRPDRRGRASRASPPAPSARRWQRPGRPPSRG